MPENEKLELKFDPNTIEDLGVKMYSQLPQALAELVANAYDADAENVYIKLYDQDPSSKKIVVTDDGFGMSFQEINHKFLRIGRRRRIEDGFNRKTPKGRVITGRKGLGKLALFGIGKNITIETSKNGDAKSTRFILNWDEIIKGGESSYKPHTSFIEKTDSSVHGTSIVLSELSRVSSFDLYSTAISLSKMFNCFDKDFKVHMQKNDEDPIIELSRDLRYQGIKHEFCWNVEDIVHKIKSDYAHKSELKGKIVSSAEGKTMPHQLRGITLYANGRLVNTPGFFGLGETPHAFSYLSGWIDADFLDEGKEDVIATDRQSIRWDLPEPEKLQEFLQKIVRYVEKAWLEGRQAKKRQANTTKAGVDLAKWYSTLPNQDVKDKIEGIVNKISENPNLDSDEYSGVVKKLHELIPEYPLYYWRYLHPSVKDSTKEYYEKAEYYDSIQEGLKRYISNVRERSKDNESTEKNLMFKNFGMKNGSIQNLSVVTKYKKPNGQPFQPNTLQNIEDSQAHLSAGMVIGFRHPLAHEEKRDLRDSGALTEKDCLDALSLLSYLFRRLDDVKE